MAMLSAIPALPISDLTRSLSFYANTLGFALRHIDDDYAIVKRDAVEIHLWIAAKPLPGLDYTPPVGSAVCKIHVSGVRQLYDEYAARGVIHPEGHLSVRDAYMSDFMILDVDGNVLQFFDVDISP